MYESKTKTTKIVATSRAAVKIKDNYYTIEYSEERTVPDVEDVDLSQERRILWDEVNAVVDDQIASIVETFKSWWLPLYFIVTIVYYHNVTIVNTISCGKENWIFAVVKTCWVMPGLNGPECITQLQQVIKARKMYRHYIWRA